MSNLTDLKKACVVGANPLVTTFWHPPQRRKILQVLSREFGVASINYPGHASWMSWPLATELRQPTPLVFEIRPLDCQQGGERVFTYDFRPETP